MDKYKVLHFSRKNRKQALKIGDTCLSSDIHEKLDILVEDKLNMNQQCNVKTVNSILGYINRRTAPRLRKVMVLLLYSVLVRHHLEYWVVLLFVKLEWVQKKETGG